MADNQLKQPAPLKKGKKYKLIATCAFGLEKLVNKELKDLKIWVDHNEEGRVIFDGNEEDIVRANLWLRLAERVQMQIARFEATTFDELFDQVFAVDWANVLPRDATFPVLCTTANSMLHHEPSIQSIAKKAIVKKLQTVYGGAETIPETGPTYSILIRFYKDICTVSIDTTGDSLHKRGYRTQANVAPIKETLAASLVKFSDWKIDEPLIDPFCGSGTILIEAAMIALNKAPGINRNFAFQTWPNFPQDLLEPILKEAVEKEIQNPDLKIFGYDIDKLAIENAKENAKRAGVENVIKFYMSDFKNAPVAIYNNATTITNPPYGERLSNPEEVTTLYQKFGLAWQKSQNGSLFLITSFPEFENVFGKKADKNRKLYNGKIKCYLYQYLKKQNEPTGTLPQ